MDENFNLLYPLPKLQITDSLPVIFISLYIEYDPKERLQVLMTLSGTNQAAPAQII